MAVQLIIVDDPAKAIVKMRKNMGWTQPELALKADVSPQTILAIETGQVTPENGTLKKIFDAFGGKYKLKYALEDRDGDMASYMTKKKKRF